MLRETDPRSVAILSDYRARRQMGVLSLEWVVRLRG
jgi:hypothetical protein